MSVTQARVQQRGAGRRRFRLHGWAPYLLLLPGIAWLVVFYLVPIASMVGTSLQDPSAAAGQGSAMAWHFQNYAEGMAEYWPMFLRSLWYAFLATLFALFLSYPLAYVIAFKVGRFKPLLLMLSIGAFFTNFLIRTLAWGSLLGRDGWVLSLLQTLHVVGVHDRILTSPAAVVIGLTYNFFPFMLLPIYANLERLDGSVLEAARDLYSDGLSTLRHVILPLSLPGIVAGTLLTFIPACGDFINAQLLGSTFTYMIGNAIYSQFLIVRDYAVASALSVCLIMLIVVMVFSYTKWAGTDEIL